MTLREVETTPPLLARKGAAAPAGSRGAEGAAAKPSPAPAALVADTGKAASAKPKNEAAPAASLLPFDLLRQRFRPGDTEGLAADEPDLSAADVSPDPPQRPVLAAEPARTLRADASTPAPKPDAAPAPTPSPEWRVGAAPKAPPRATSGGWLLPVGALAAAVAALVVGWTLTNRAPDSAPGADAVAMAEPAASPQIAEPASSETAQSAPIDIAPSPAAAPLQAQLPAPELTAPDGAIPQTAEPPVAEPVAPPSAEAQAEAQIAAPVAAPEPTPAPELAAPAPAAVAIKPTVDVVRLEPNGEAVIAGRAAPSSELIILDNGTPIGTATADAFGEWVFVPTGTLPSGAHEFGLVVKTVEQTVRLPAPAKPTLPPAPSAAPLASAPAADSIAAEPPVPAPAPMPVEAIAAAEPATDVGSVPVPVRKPESAGAAPADTQVADTHAAGPTGDAAVKADFVVQLASVKSRAGAETEWRKLQQRFPDILGPMAPSLDEVKLAENGTFYRIRTGAFASQAEAADLCARLAAGNQDCLVVRTSAGN